MFFFLVERSSKTHTRHPPPHSDLNLVRQVRDHWGFQQTARLPMYASLLTRAAGLAFEPQVIRDTGVDAVQADPVDGEAKD